MEISSIPSPVINSRHIESRILRQRAWADWFEDQHQHNLRFWRVIQTIKLCLLLAVWACITFVLESQNGHAKVTKSAVTVMPYETVLRKVTLSQGNLRVTLRGPIDEHLTKHPEEAKSFGAGVRVEYRNLDLNVTYRWTSMWNIVLEPKSSYNEVTNFFKISPPDATNFFKISPPDAANMQAVVSVESKSDSPVGLMMEMEARPVSDRNVLFAGLLIILLYLVILSKVIDRTFVALLICAIGIAALAVQGDRPELTTIVSFVNFDTLMLLFGLMAIVDLMATTGIFDNLVVQVYRVSMGQPWPVVLFLSLLTAFLSAFLNSDNMAIVLTPVTIRLCETMALQTQFVLIIMAIYANLGGALTPLGNTPNAIVSNHRVAVDNGVNFINFMCRMLPGVIIAMLVAFPLLYLILRKRLFRLDQYQLSVMDMRAQRIMQPSEETLKRVAQREGRQPRKWWLKPGDNYNEILTRLEDRYPIRDKPLLIKCCIILVFAYLCMILHCFTAVAEGVTLGWVILFAAFLLIILDNKSHLDGTLGTMQWTLLLFVASLFVLTETVARLGLFKWLGDRAAKALSSIESPNQSKVIVIVIIWTTAALSVPIDNLVVTDLMLSFCFHVTDKNLLPFQPVIWAITFGSCFGGNASLLAASSNEIIAWSAREAGYKISFCRFFVIAFPIMLVTLVICTAYLLIDISFTTELNPLSSEVNMLYNFLPD